MFGFDEDTSPAFEFPPVVKIVGDQGRGELLRGRALQLLRNSQSQNTQNLPVWQTTYYQDPLTGRPVAPGIGADVFICATIHGHGRVVIGAVSVGSKKEVFEDEPLFSEGEFVPGNDDYETILCFMVEKPWGEMESFCPGWNDDTIVAVENTQIEQNGAVAIAYAEDTPSIPSFDDRFARVYVRLGSRSFKFMSASKVEKTHRLDDPWSVILWRRYFVMLNGNEDYCFQYTPTRFVVGQHLIEPAFQYMIKANGSFINVCKTRAGFCWVVSGGKDEDVETGWRALNSQDVTWEQHEDEPTSWTDDCFGYSYLGDSIGGARVDPTYTPTNYGYVGTYTEYRRVAVFDGDTFIGENRFKSVASFAVRFSWGDEVPTGDISRTLRVTNRDIIPYSPSITMLADTTFSSAEGDPEFDAPDLEDGKFAFTAKATFERTTGTASIFYHTTSGTSASNYWCTYDGEDTDIQDNVANDTIMGTTSSVTFKRQKVLYPGDCDVTISKNDNSVELVLSGGSDVSLGEDLEDYALLWEDA